MGAAGVVMDTINNVDQYLQEKVPAIYEFVNGVPVFESMVVRSGNQVYGVNFTGVHDKITENVGKIFDAMHGKASLMDLSQLYDAADKALSREGFCDLTGVSIQEIQPKTNPMALAEYLQVLDHVDRFSDYGHDIGKVLQYNAGSTKILDTEHPYIPESFSKSESLSFMRDMAESIKFNGLRDGNAEQVTFGQRLSGIADYIQYPDRRKSEDRYKDYSAADVQSIFNTFGERYTELMGGVDNYDMVRKTFELKTVAKQTYDMIISYNASMSNDMQMASLRGIFHNLPGVFRGDKGSRDNAVHEGIDVIIDSVERGNAAKKKRQEEQKQKQEQQQQQEQNKDKKSVMYRMV